MEQSLIKLFEDKSVILRLKNGYRAVGLILDVTPHSMVLFIDGCKSAYDNSSILLIFEVKGVCNG